MVSRPFFARKFVIIQSIKCPHFITAEQLTSLLVVPTGFSQY